MKRMLVITLAAGAVLAACQTAPSGEMSAQAAAGGPSEGPEMICRMEPVMGSRVRKQEVCSPARFNTDAGDGLQGLHNDSGKSGLPEYLGDG